MGHVNYCEDGSVSELKCIYSLSSSVHINK